MLANDCTLRNLDPRRAREGLRVLPEQAGDRVLAVRGHARRARRRAGATAARTSACARPTTATSIGDCDAGPEMHFSFFDLIAAHREDAAVHRRHDPRQRHGVERGSRARHLVPRRAPDDRDIESGKPTTPFMSGRRPHRDRGVRRRRHEPVRHDRSARGRRRRMKLVLHNYWRSSASHRVRIALGLKELPYEYVVVNIVEARAARRRLSREEPDGAGADARDHRGRRHGPRAHPVAADPRVSRRAVPASRRCCRRDLVPARARAALAEIVNSGIQPLQNLTTHEAGQGARRRRRRCGRSASSPTASPRSSARPRDDWPARSASATRRRSPTAASSRSSRRARRFGVDIAQHAAPRRDRGALPRAARVRRRACPTANPTR